MGKATAKPRDSSRENRIGPREKISSRTGQLAAPYLGACGGEIQNQRKRVHSLACIPAKWSHFAEKDSRQINMLAQILIARLAGFALSQGMRRGDDVAVRGGDAAIGKMDAIFEAKARIDSELP